MNDFDDNEIRDALRRRAGGATDGLGLEAAHSAVVARAGRVRRRRAAAAGGATMAGLVAVAVFVIGPATDSVVTTPADQTNESVAASVDTSAVATSTVLTSPDQTGLEQADRDPNATGTTPPTNTSLSRATTVPANEPPAGSTPSTTVPVAPTTTVSAPPTTTTTTTPEPTSTEPAPPTSATVPSTTAAPSPEPIIETYSSAGGSITVRWDGASLSLQGVAPAAGFDPEVEDERADRIRVRFQGDDDEFRIEIRVEDGEIVRIE